MKISRVIAAIYGFLCVAALLLIPASLGGWFGLERDPLAGIFAILLGAPWSYLLNFAPSLGVWFNVAAVALGMAMNFLIILVVGDLLGRLRRMARR